MNRSNASLGLQWPLETIPVTPSCRPVDGPQQGACYLGVAFRASRAKSAKVWPDGISENGERLCPGGNRRTHRQIVPGAK
jgi:hypothetical protein